MLRDHPKLFLAWAIWFVLSLAAIALVNRGGATESAVRRQVWCGANGDKARRARVTGDLCREGREEFGLSWHACLGALDFVEGYCGKCSGWSVGDVRCF